MSPSCGCCGACVYEASDGNVYSDDFSGSLDANWTAGVVSGTADSIAINSGRLEATYNGSGTGKYVLHSTDDGSYAWSAIKVILECTVYAATRSANQAIRLDLANTPGGFGISAALYVNWNDGTFDLSASDNDVPYGGGSVSLSQTPADGDKITLIVEHVSGDEFRVCAFVNDEVFGELYVTYGFSGANAWVTPWMPYEHDSASAGETTFKIDNYTLHIGNP